MPNSETALQAHAPWLDQRLRLHAHDGTVATASDIAQLAAGAAAALPPEVRRLTIDASQAQAVLVALALAQRRPLDIALARETALASLPSPQRVQLAPGVVAWFDPPAGDAEGPLQASRVRLSTSGTTGHFKSVVYPLDRLTANLQRHPAGQSAVWLLTYEPASFAGLQVLLTAAANGAAVLAPQRTVAALAQAAVQGGATHISGTPSFWRALLSSIPLQSHLPLRVATLGGEACSQDLLDAIRVRFPEVTIRHIYASTEAGVGFTVTDGRAGFPADWLVHGIDGIALRVHEDELQIRTARGMLGYDGRTDEATDGGWFGTGDLVEVEAEADRVLFQGRRDSVVNIGGTKVLPEKVEACLATVEGVIDIAVLAHPSPILGHILIAQVYAVPGADAAVVEAALKARAMEQLTPVARPVRYRFVDSVVTASGKKGRKHGSV
ncbi:fatty acid--CoA ligase family protein [Herbaspirillum sp. YR522]|uniref:ANL family adenylate-forming protein n=1 Tax=Herbaspirillum sp. YR522 TaxID=1144342 RepID=UPI00026FAA94|nr:fatty acid--CoA ligase family protein [Herbaspirillum sp. YR522]EJN09796.1 acyl-CoA synthetase (AMP-forming)/AMP-acid ligase II [Herbaspirillum sp. YR522]